MPACPWSTPLRGGTDEGVELSKNHDSDPLFIIRRHNPIDPLFVIRRLTHAPDS